MIHNLINDILNFKNEYEIEPLECIISPTHQNVIAYVFIAVKHITTDHCYFQNGLNYICFNTSHCILFDNMSIR